VLCFILLSEILFVPSSFSERFGLLTILALGETIGGLTFDSVSSTLGGSHAAAVLGFGIPYCIQLIYFDMDARNHKHALRRNTWTGIGFTSIHLPLHMTIVASSLLFYFFIPCPSTLCLDHPSSCFSWLWNEKHRLLSVFAGYTSCRHCPC